MYFGMFDPTIVVLIPAIIFALYAQSKVKHAYSKYLRVGNKRGITGPVSYTHLTLPTIA